MSQASEGFGTDLAELLNAIQEFGQVLHACTGTAVRDWTPEHVSNAFGWANWVEVVIRGVECNQSDMLPTLEANITALQDASAATGAMPSRTSLAFTCKLLAHARALLFRLLLTNSQATHEVAQAAIRQALTWDTGGDVQAATAALLPSVRVTAEALLLSQIHNGSLPCLSARTTTVADSAQDQGEDGDTVPAAPAAAVAPAAAAHAAAPPAAAAPPTPRPKPSTTPAAEAAIAMAVAATQSLGKIAASAATDLHHLPTSTLGMAVLAWSKAEEEAPHAPLPRLVQQIHAAAAAHESTARSLWESPPSIVAGVCAAEAAVAATRGGDATAAATANSTVRSGGGSAGQPGWLAHHYCCHLIRRMHELGEESEDASGLATGEDARGFSRQWREWQGRWRALLSMLPPSAKRHAESLLESELAGLEAPGQAKVLARLRYLAHLAAATCAPAATTELSAQSSVW